MNKYRLINKKAVKVAWFVWLTLCCLLSAAEIVVGIIEKDFSLWIIGLLMLILNAFCLYITILIEKYKKEK